MSVRWRNRWRKGAHSFTLHRGGRGPALAMVEPDALYPGMWRVRMPDGRYSNMVNLAQAKEAALSFVDREATPPS
jgi:hypothetical protein